MNLAILTGNLTEEPKIKATNTGKMVANFTVATNEYYMKDGEKVNTSQYHRCVAWGNLAETVGELTKGSPVTVLGKITTRKYESSMGEKKYITEIVCSNVSTHGKSDGAEGFVKGVVGAKEEVPF